MFLNKLQNIVRSRGSNAPQLPAELCWNSLVHHITGDSAGQINNQLSSIRGGPRSISGDVDFLLILAQKKTNPPAKWTANDAGLPVPLV